MNTPPVALGDELVRIIDGLTIDGQQEMHCSARNVLLSLCTAADRNRETETVLVREEHLLASELEKYDDLEQLAALIQHPIKVEKGRIHVSPHKMPETPKLGVAA